MNLTDGMREIADLVVVHDYVYSRSKVGEDVVPDSLAVTLPPVPQKLVRTNPVTGRPSVLIGAHASRIVGMDPEESRALLDALFGMIATTPRLYCRVDWQPNTLTLWDNRCTQHHAVWDYYPYTRSGERVSVVGDEPPRGVHG